MGLFSAAGRIKSFIFQRFGLTLITTWSCMLYYTALTVTVSTVDEDLLYPVKLLIHPQTVGYLLATFVFSMVICSLMSFYGLERRNRVDHWLQHPNVKEACANNPIEGLDNYKWVVSKKEIGRKPVTLQCPACEVETSSRAHHCPKCDRCVLRRDHHCFLLGTCVGLGNQRFFINSLFWCAFGCALFIAFHGYHFLSKSYAMIHQNRWLFREEIDSILTSGQFERSLLVMAFCLYNLPNDEYLCDAIILTFTIVWLLITFVFFCVHMAIVAKGYTMYELFREKVRQRVHPDGRTLADRFRVVFGERWLLNIFLPIVWDEAVITPEAAVNLFRPKNKAE